MDKSLKVLGAKISGTQKSCDDRLKKITDEQNDIKNKLGKMQKKEGKLFTQKDLGDIVYEEKLPKALFVNTYGSELMTTLLVVVNKKKIDVFRQVYPELLIQFNQTDFENWKKRTRAHIAA